VLFFYENHYSTIDNKDLISNKTIKTSLIVILWREAGDSMENKTNKSASQKWEIISFIFLLALIVSIAFNAWQHQKFQKDIVNEYVLDYRTTSGYFQNALADYNKTQNQEELSQNLEMVRDLHYPYMTKKFGSGTYIGQNAKYLGEYLYYIEWVSRTLYQAADSAKTNSLSDEELKELQKVDKFFKDYDESVFKDDYLSVSLYELKKRLKDFHDRYPKEN